MKIIPAIDLRNGICVRLFKGDFNQETRYSSDPVQVAQDYRAMGFQHLHVVDLDGAQSGKQGNRRLVARLVAESGLEVQLGGGIRDRDTVSMWFDRGVSRIVVGSAAIADAVAVRAWMQEHGADRFILALDCQCDDHGTPWLSTHGWTRRSNTTLWDGIDNYLDAGLSQVLCTDISRDGAMTGPSTDLYAEFIGRFPGIDLQASGGVRDIADLRTLHELGAAGAITGRALLDGRITAAEVATFLQDE